MERNFKKEIQEAASNPIDMAEMMAQLVQVRYGYVDGSCSCSSLHARMYINLLSGISAGLTEAVVREEETRARFMD